MAIGYRKDIQILRGIAVLLVVLFHLDIAHFNSGFLGVDVFFVISGYLMSRIYNPSEKKFFFVKRIKRLIPAYFTVVVLTVLFSFAITVPVDYHQVSSQSIFATFFLSNIGFWLENSYFDKTAFKPFLHLWSLGVEIQFYALMPILCWLFKKMKINYLIVLLLSAGMCFFVVGISPKTSFYWLPLRLWEFLLGYGVATYFYNDQAANRKIVTWVGAAALLTIISIPLIPVDGDAHSFMEGHPGVMAMIICIATAAVLSFGLPRVIKDNPAAGLLERIGEYSYSIYLAHFPLIVLFLYQPFSGTVLKVQNSGQTAILVALIVCTSWLLYQFVEKPFRANNKSIRLVLAMGALVLCIAPLGVMAQKAVTPEKEMFIYQAWNDRDDFRCGKINRIIHPFEISCEVTKQLKIPSGRILLVGNSHADSIKATFSSVAQARNVAVYFMVENQPLRQGGITPEGLIHEALARKIDLIVLHYSPGSIDFKVIDRLAVLAEGENIKLAFIMPVPVWSKSIPVAIINNMHKSEDLPYSTIKDYMSYNADLINHLDAIEYGQFSVYQTADVFCRDVCQFVSVTGKPLYFDKGHLTLTGSDMLREVFSRVMDDFLRKKQVGGLF